MLQSYCYCENTADGRYAPLTVMRASREKRARVEEDDMTETERCRTQRGRPCADHGSHY